MTAAQNVIASEQAVQWHLVCETKDLVTNSGVCALVDSQQVALFCLKIKGETQVFAISNYDPIGKANVLYRGLLGSIGGAPVVASPLYKEHYFLETGLCKEHDDVSVTAYPVKVEGEKVFVGV
ncbi:nitrite reductase (NAD(P)H) small subunit [marine sediment metagenome]|uniref:Nitrite reductase (NAD(P)H) small subunit n=1 Tax=marine sediment metagenome TaxID=412755 RepID=A0A1B6NPM3_9ZZZZ